MDFGRSRAARSAMWEPIKPAPPVMRMRLPFIGENLFDFFGFLGRAPAQEARRNSCHDCESRHIGRYDRARADNCALANRDTRQDDRIGAYVGPCLDPDRFDLQVGLDDGDVVRNARMGRTQQFGARTPADMVAQEKIAGIQKRLRPDPHVVADRAMPVEAALYAGLRADEDSLADAEGFGMAERGAGTDPQARATPPGERAPDGAAHECVDGSVTRAETAVKLDQAVARIGLPEKGIETRLEIQVARCGLPAMHGLHDASMRLSLNGHRLPAPWRQ